VKETEELSIQNRSSITGTESLRDEITIPRPVTFNANGGTIEEGRGLVLIRPGEPIGTLPTASREHFNFRGWWAERIGGREITPNEIITRAITVFARWASNPKNNNFLSKRRKRWHNSPHS